MPRHTDRKPGWQNRKMKAAEKRAREQAAAKRAAATTVGKGGIVIKDGGSLTSKYPAEMGGGEATRFGPLKADESSTPGYAFQLKDELGALIFAAVRNLPTPGTFSGSTGVFTFAETLFLNTKLGAGFSVFTENAEVTGNTVHLRGTFGTMIDHATTGASANMFIDPSDNRIWRSTSSRRYKQDIDDVAVDPDAVLRMRPRTWRDKAQVEQDPETQTHYVGFIAEELHDLGLTAFVVYDDEGEPEAISYDRLTAALVPLAQQQQRELDALRGQLGELVARVEALESSR